MKNLIITLVLLCSGLTSFADSWQDLTMKEAKKAERFLKKNPYILDYCDCCSSGDPVRLIKVVSVAIVPCEYNEEKFSLQVEGIIMAHVNNTGVGLNEHNADFSRMGDEVYTISMNYTFAYDKKMHWATPLFKIIGYDLDHVCRGATNFPKPPKIIDGLSQEIADYDLWYGKRIRKFKPVRE